MPFLFPELHNYILGLAEKEAKNTIESTELSIMERVKSVQEKTGEDINFLQETMKAKFQVAVENIGKVQDETQKFQKETEETVKMLNTKLGDDIEIIKMKLANERKEIEMELRDKEGDANMSENVFMNILNFIKTLDEKNKEEALKSSNILRSKQEKLEQDLDDKQKSIETAMTTLAETNTSEKEKSQQLIR